MKRAFLLVPAIVTALALGAMAPAVSKPPPDKGKAPGTMVFVGAPYTVAEGAGSVTVTVARETSLGEVTGKGRASVDITTSDGTATAGSDYTAVTQTLTFSRGETTATVNIPILEDTAVEGNESFTLTLSNAIGRYNLTDPTTTVTITDNDTAGPLLLNGGFEVSGTLSSPPLSDSAFGWTIRRPLPGDTSTNPWPAIVTTALGGNSPFEGTYVARMGGDFAGSADSQIQQNITVPASGTTTLTWRYQASCQIYTHAYLLIYSVPESGAPTILWDTTESWQATWTLVSKDLTAYAGQTIKLVFGATTSSFNDATLWIDDVQVTNVP